MEKDKTRKTCSNIEGVNMSYESNSIYIQKFQRIHKLLKEYGCKATYPDEHEEFYSSAWHRGKNFYRNFKESDDAKFDFKPKQEWKEVIDVSMDVIIKTKIKEAVLEELRIDLEYSSKASKYSMYINLPTHERCTVLSKDIYTNQNDVIGEIQKWICYCKCKKVKEKKAETKLDHMQQLSLF